MRRQTLTFLAIGCSAAAFSFLPAAASAADALPEGCDLDYRVKARPDLQPAALEVELRFAAAGRRESVIRAVPAWAGVTDYAASYGDWQALQAGQRIQPLAEPFRWQVQHGPDELVQLRWRVRSALADPEAIKPQEQVEMYRTQVGARGFQFFGHGVLPSVEHWGDDRLTRLCLTLQPFDAQSPALGTPGLSAPGQALTWRLSGSHARLRHAFYASGPMWRLQQRPVQGGVLDLALRGSYAQLGDAEFADASARLVDLQRRFWGDEQGGTQASAGHQWLVLTPNHLPSNNSGGTLVDKVAVMHVPQDFSARDGAFEFLVAHENLHQWFPQRFGAHGGGRRTKAEAGGDALDVPHYWFSEGFTDHYSYRLLLASGLWDLDRYADKLTERARAYLRSPARGLKAAEIAPRFFSDREAGRQMYSRGELLALRWDAALRQAGRGSLSTLLQGLLLPAGTREDQEPASERVLQALAKALAGTGIDPDDELRRYVAQGEPLPLAQPSWAEAMGPCLQRIEESVPVWQLGFDRASFQSRVLQGVDPEGPAHAAGLRDGMALAGFSVHGGDVRRDVQLQIREPGVDGAPGKVREVAYRPVSRMPQQLPRWQAKADAAGDAACRAWISAR